MSIKSLLAFSLAKVNSDREREGEGEGRKENGRERERERVGKGIVCCSGICPLSKDCNERALSIFIIASSQSNDVDITFILPEK